MGNEKDRLVTVEELANYLGVKTRTVLNWATTGRLPRPMKLSKRTLRWRLADVEAAMATMATTA